MKPIALSMGEPTGIGAEIALLAWEKLQNTPLNFFLIDDPERVAKIARDLSWNVPVETIAKPGDTSHVFPNALPVLPHPVKPFTFGKPDRVNAKNVITSISRAVEFVQNGHAGGVVTNPIQKNILIEDGFDFPGHTEFLAHLANIDHPPIMMLASDELKVVPLTIHMSMQETLKTLSKDFIVEKTKIIAKSMIEQWGIENPRLAIAGLNPHAGENGAMGREELDIIGPAVQELQSLGLDAKGPYPPDTMFHKAARAQYDVAVCMYHDQALIPIKTIAFDEGVNVTLGLPFIRTSPDHGTALDIAGQGLANPTSLICALEMAAKMIEQKAQIL